MEAVGAVIILATDSVEFTRFYAHMSPIVALYLQISISSLDAQFLLTLGRSLPALSLLKLGFRPHSSSRISSFISALTTFPVLTHLEFLLGVDIPTIQSIRLNDPTTYACPTLCSVDMHSVVYVGTVDDMEGPGRLGIPRNTTTMAFRRLSGDNEGWVGVRRPLELTRSQRWFFY